MIRVILLFLVLTGLSYLAVRATEKMTGAQLLTLTKYATYFIIASAIALIVMGAIVFLF